VWCTGTEYETRVTYSVWSRGRGCYEENDRRGNIDALDVIAQRRSIRRFRDAPIPDNVIEKILTTATLAPSGKNAQSWRYVVVREEARADMVRIMRDAVERVRDRDRDIDSSAWTANVMEQAPVTVFVFNDNAENTPGRDGSWGVGGCGEFFSEETGL
jgi:hypothetical protein